MEDEKLRRCEGGRSEAGRKREDRCARMKEDGRKKDKEDQNTGGRGTEVGGEKMEVEKVRRWEGDQIEDEKVRR
jgi:hypothetical protein